MPVLHRSVPLTHLNLLFRSSCDAKGFVYYAETEKRKDASSLDLLINSKLNDRDEKYSACNTKRNKKLEPYICANGKLAFKRLKAACLKSSEGVALF